MDIIKAVYGCLTGQLEHDYDAIDERAPPNTQDVATSILDALKHAEKPGQHLERTLNNLVGEYGWYESLAVAVLNQVENALRAGVPMGQAMKDAYNKSVAAAVGFAHDHPVFCTLVALGILVTLVPWAVEVLGFGELGPIEGTLNQHGVVDRQMS
jgi:hypothetical protein